MQRRLLWVGFSLLGLLLGVGYFWGRGYEPQAPSAVASQVSSGAVKTSLTQPVQSVSPIQTGGLSSPKPAAAKTNQTVKNRFPYRLSNTTKTVDELSRSDKAILMGNALIDTATSVNLPIPENLRAGPKGGSYMVQARGPVDDAFRALLNNANATIVSYVPNNAYLVRMSAGNALELGGNPAVQTVLNYEPYYKLEPGLLKMAMEQKQFPGDGELNVTVFPDAHDATVAALTAAGADVVSEQRSPFGPVLKVHPASGTMLPQLAAIPGVQALAMARPRVHANDLSRTRMGVSANTTNLLDYLGLTGSNILININDSGVDVTHPDLTNRVTGDFNFSLSDTSGHGTHVAGTIIGSGVVSSTVGTNAVGSLKGASFRGMASAAKLFSMDLSASDPYLQEQAALTNAFISNNSWNYGGASEYNIEAASYDAAVRDALPLVTGSQPVLFVFSAGNDGSGDDGGLSGNSDTILSPGTAKNVITVGALEQERDITNNVTVQGLTNQPFFSGSDSSNEVAGFSSRGNVGIGVEGLAGRFKPDVIAPGTYVISDRSGQWDTNAYYNPTNYHFNTFFNQTVDTNTLQAYSISIPDNAVGLIITVSANQHSSSPFPTNIPIYLNYGSPPALTDPSKPSPVNLPRDFTFTPGDTLFYSVYNNTTNPTLNFNLETELITTNDNGNYFDVLRGLNDSLGQFYRYESGTSMSAAGVSGFLALMQEFFEQRVHLTNSPALMKALLINGSRSVSTLYDMQVGTSQNYQGWGLPSLPNSLPGVLTNYLTQPDSVKSFPLQFFDQNPTNALATGQSKTRTLAMTPGGRARPLRVTLVWTDPPGNPSVGIKLVNDLDLIVTNLTTGEVFYGNDIPAGSDFNEPWDTNAPPQVDLVNNVENVYLSPPLGSNYSVTVSAKRVNVNAVTLNTNNVVQDYALVISSGDGGALSNAFTLTDVPQTFTNLAHIIQVTNGVPLLGQRVGANSQYSVSTNGVVGQWNFYVYTNTTAFTNVAIVTFLPPNIGVPRMGTRVSDPVNAVRTEADLDLYVSTDPTLTNLNPVAIANSLESRTRTGTEKILLSNSIPGQIYYVGVKSEDQQGAEYDFLAAASQFPFGQRDGNGNIPVVMLASFPVSIPDGSPSAPGHTVMVGVSSDPGKVRRAIVTNSVTHENFGDLVGTLSHGKHFSVLNNHSFFDNAGISETFVYDDSNEGDITGSRPSDGPGSLQNFVDDRAIDGVWTLTMIDDSLTQTGRVDNLGITLEPVPPTNGVPQFIGAHKSKFFPIDVPSGATNLTVTILSNSLPLNIYLRHGSRPSPQVGLPSVYDKSAFIPVGGGSLSLSVFDNPPLNPGVYYLEVYNNNNSPQFWFGPIISIGVDLNPPPQPRFITSGPIPILDDAVTYSTNHVSLDQLINGTEVGVRIDHPRVSDLVLTLVSPQGTRVLLAENRGGLSTNGYGAGINTTNVFPTANAGAAEAATNIIAAGVNAGTIIIDYDFFTIPDAMHIYYDGTLIFDSGLIGGSGQFAVDFGPGVSQNVEIVMNEGGNNQTNTAWNYTATIITRGIAYATFSEDTNKALIPIKFATPPFGTNTTGFGNLVSDFEGWAPTNYFAPMLLDGWSILANKVTVLSDLLQARSGTNFLNLRDGKILRTLPTIAGGTYKLQFAYRRATPLDPVHWWPGNSNTVDIVSGNDGAWVNPPGSYIPLLEVGPAFDFNAPTDPGTNYVKVVGDPSLNLGEGPGFTIDAWINSDDISNQAPILNWNDASGFDNGVEFWVNGGGQGTVAVNLIGSLTNGVVTNYFIVSSNNVIAPNVNVHVAMSYEKSTMTNQFGTNVLIGITKLYANGAVVANVTNDLITPETSFDVYFGQQIAGALGGTRFAGEIDEIGFYDHTLTDAQVQDIFAAGSEGRPGTLTPPLVSPPVQANVLIDGAQADTITARSDWMTESLIFTAQANGTPLELDFTNCPSGMLLDSFTLTAPGENNYFLPEDSLDRFQGESALGDWVLEILDNRAGATNPPPQLQSWQLNFGLEITSPRPIPLVHAIPQTNSVGPNSIRYFVVDVPVWARFATNILIADGPVNLLFNQSLIPGTNSSDISLQTLSTGGTTILSTNSGNPILQPGQHYFLGVQNTGATLVNFSIEVDFDITTLTNAIALPVTNAPPGSVRYFQYDVTTNAIAAAFEILNPSGNVDLVVRQGPPLPDLTSFALISNNPGSNNEAIVVTTNSSPIVLTAGRWYLGVFNNDSTNVSYSVRATETAYPTIITLTNGVPFDFNSAPGAAFTNFFRFVVDPTNTAALFELYNLSGNADLTLQRDQLPWTPPYFDGSFRLGLNPEQIVIRTNQLGTNIGAQWFLGVPNNETNTVTYTIRAVVSTNGLLISGIPIDVGILPPGSGGTNGPVIQWPSVPGEKYQIQITTNLFSPFTPYTNIVAGGSTTIFIDPAPVAGQPMIFYRIIQIP
jgi:subtilisin-like proprotein convertase family protein